MKKVIILFSFVIFAALCGYPRLGFSQQQAVNKSQVNSDSEEEWRQDLIRLGIKPRSPPPPPIVLDNTPYTKEDLIKDFINISFSNVLWLENSITPLESVSVYNKRLSAGYKKGQNWLSEFTYRPEGLPKSGVLNRVPSTIQVAAGWPAYQTEWLNRLTIPGRENDLQLIQKQLEELLPELNARLGLSIQLVPRGDAREQGKDFAKIRIIPFGYSMLINNYRNADVLPPYWNSHEPSHTIIASFLGAVAFTPFSKSQVDGFSLPNVNSDIDLSICRVSTVLDKEMIKNLMAECILRSLGLPSLSKDKGNHLLGGWNVADDVNSKTPFSDGISAFRGADELHAANFNFHDYNKASSREVKVTPPASYPLQSGKLSEYDAFMVKLLYCSDLKSGMDKIAVIDALLKSKTCFPQ